MAITQTGSISTLNTSTANSGTASSTLTVPADAELVIVSVGTWQNVANYITGGGLTFTKGGVDTAMTAGSNLGNAVTTGGFYSALFYLVSPDTGTNKTLKWDFSGSSTANEVTQFSVTYWKGINLASPVRDTSGAQSIGLPCNTGTMTAQTGDLIVAFSGFFSTGGANGSVNSWTNLTTLGQLTNTSNTDGAWATTSPTGNTSVGALTGTTWEDGSIVALVLKPAGGGPSAWSRIQGYAETPGNTDPSSLAFPAPVSNLSMVVGAITYSEPTRNLLSVTDDMSNAYTIAEHFDDTPSGFRTAYFYSSSRITNAPQTLTFDFNMD